MQSKQHDSKKSIIVTPSKVVSRPDNLHGGEETEIAAQISLPQEGRWGWVVVTAAFWSIYVFDGVSYTFGSLLGDITKELQVADSLVALINSIAIALYFIASPLSSALINRFGFRACAMAGSSICAFSLLISYFTTNYASLCMFYGVFAGFGYSLLNMSAGLIVGFYFEKLRSLAMAIATTGSSVGIMTLFPFNTYMVKVVGWRTVTLFHSGLFGIVYFLSMTFRPLLSFTVVQTNDATNDPTRTVTYLPSVSVAGLKPTSSRVKVEELMPTVTERLFSAVSNANFPTAAKVVDEGAATVAKTTTQPGPSTAAVSKITLNANNPQGSISRRQLKQVQSIISKTGDIDKGRKIDINIQVEESVPRKRRCWERLCHWDEHVPQSRPMYRDDAFYDGKLENLPAYQKSVMQHADDGQAGIDYQLAVSRAATARDLKERRGVFTTATRRVLATMMDPGLLKKYSFIMLCCSGFVTYVGYLVPYVFLQSRNEEAGIDSKHCSLFVSIIGFANAVGRLVLGALACKVDPLKLYAISCCASGIITILSDLSYHVYYQYFYCCFFGFFIASLACLRCMSLVSLYGLDKLTNATGMMLLFQGLGSLISTPVAGIIKNNFGYSCAFYVSGVFMLLGGIILTSVRSLSILDNKQAVAKKSVSIISNK